MYEVDKKVSVYYHVGFVEQILRSGEHKARASAAPEDEGIDELLHVCHCYASM